MGRLNQEVLPLSELPQLCGPYRRLRVLANNNPDIRFSSPNSVGDFALEIIQPMLNEVGLAQLLGGKI